MAPLLDECMVRVDPTLHLPYAYPIPTLHLTPYLTHYPPPHTQSARERADVYTLSRIPRQRGTTIIRTLGTFRNIPHTRQLPSDRKVYEQQGQ